MFNMDQNENAYRRLNILSLDGGGVRGLSTIMILQRIMNSLNRKRGDGQILQPWQVFDLIGGTSTGGIIALMLGRLRMSIAECEDAYLKLSELIFQPRHSRFSVHRAYTFLQADGKFDASILEKAIKETLVDNGYSQDLLLQDLDDHCRCFVVATRASNSQPAILRSFENTESDNLLFGECKVWEACRATSAAPTFFDSITIGKRKQKFADGGMIYNNPVEQVHQEAELLWPGQEKLLISIGTGDAPGASFDGKIQTLVNAMKAIVTDTQIKAEDFHRTHHSLFEAKLYFRFSVAQGLANIGLEEYNAVDKIADATDVYIASPDPKQKFEECVRSLLEEKSKAQKAAEALFFKECLDSLCNSNRSHHSCHTTKNILRESCAWILSHSKYKRWELSELPSLLWLTGASGTGKTTLSSFLGTHLGEEAGNKPKPRRMVLSYFCDETTDVLMMLRHLLWHYLQLRPDFFCHIAGSFNRETSRLYDKDNQLHGLLNTLHKIGNHVPTYIIMDGLDECTDKTAVQILVEEIASWSRQGALCPTPLKVILSFGDEIALRIASQRILDTQRLDMHEEMKRADFQNLRFFAAQQVGELAQKKWIDPSKANKITEILVNRAEGSFLWLDLTCSHMGVRQRGFDATQPSLLPDGMDSMIHKMILRIDSQDSGPAARILRIVSAALRPLTFDEIADALEIRVDETKRLVESCGYLLHIYGSNIVKLYHSAIKKFLEGNQGVIVRDRDLAQYRLGTIHKEISDVCFKLFSNGLQSHAEPGAKALMANLSVRSFSGYATQYWPNHARVASLQASFFEGLHNDNLLKALWRLNWECTGLAYRNIPQYFSILHVGAVFGLPGLVEYYAKTVSQNSAKRKHHLQNKDSTGHTALSWAAEFGHEDIIQYLLGEERLDPNGIHGPFGNALQTASSWGQVHIVELLLNYYLKDRTSSINAKKGKYGTALQAAAIMGNPTIASILITNHADPNTKRSGWFGNALQAAAANGSTEVVKVLLDAKGNAANPNAQGGWFGNSLRAASTKGYTDIVQMLLDHGAKVDQNETLQDIISRIMSLRSIMTPSTKWNGLTHPAKGHSLISIVKSEATLIRSKMAKRYTKTVSTKEAFLFALHHVLFRSKLISAENSSSLGALTEEERQHLTNQGFEIYLRGLFYGNALQAAAAEGHTEVVALLIDRNADVNANVGIFGTALQAAVAENKPEVVDFLLSLDNVDVYQRGGAYGSAMSAALREGYKDLEQKLTVAGIEKQANARRESTMVEKGSCEVGDSVRLLPA